MRLRPAVVVLAGLTIAAGCVRQDAAKPDAAPPAAAAVAVPETVLEAAPAPLVLPELSSVAPSVRTQILAQHARVTMAIESGASGGEVGEQYGRLGTLLLAAEIGNAAAVSFAHARQLQPSDSRWPYYQGHLRRNSGDLAGAAAAFERALALHKSDTATLVWLGRTYFEQGRPDAADLFSRARDHGPSAAAALTGLGRTALVAGDFARAARDLEAALALDGRPSTTHYHLAMAYRGLGQPEKAKQHLARATKDELGPADPLMDELNAVLESGKAYQFRGLRALDAGQWTEAAAHFRKGLTLEPDSPWLRHGLGTALFQMQDARGALEQFNASVAASPQFARGHLSAGLVLAFTGQRDLAMRRFASAVAVNPQYLEAHLALADMLREAGRAGDALGRYREALAIDPRTAEGRFGEAMALVQLARHDEARDRLTAGEAEHPTRPEFTLALVRLLAASPDVAVRDGRRALTLMPRLLDLPERTDITETMAMVLAENGRFGEAATWQREAMAVANRTGQAPLVARMQSALSHYESGRAVRTPWRDGEHPWLGQP